MYIKILIILGFLVLLPALSSCASAPRFPEIGPDDNSYLLDAGDEVRVVVFNQETLSDTYVIGESGRISMPLIGAVHTRGMTAEGLEQRIGKRLAEGYLTNPHVRVEVVKYRPFYILGEVQAPGEYPYSPGLTVMAAVALGGGFTYRADDDDLRVTRRLANGEVVKGRASPRTAVLPGDIIHVGERIF